VLLFWLLVQVLKEIDEAFKQRRDDEDMLTDLSGKFYQLRKIIVTKYHNYEKDGSIFLRMLSYVYKDYLAKYLDTQVIHGLDFDVDMFEADLPDEAMQTLLQAAVPTITLSPIWANHEAKWREYSPTDLSVNDCHRYLAHRF